MSALRELPNEGRSAEWYTPPHVFEALGLRFDLDPCAPPSSAAPWIPADSRYSLPANGLALPWSGRVWLNPPYGRETWDWLDRLAQHGNGVALIFARTDVIRFHDLAPRFDAMCLIRKRLQFIDGRGQHGLHNAAAPSVLLAWGAENALALERSGLGMTVS